MNSSTVRRAIAHAWSLLLLGALAPSVSAVETCVDTSAELLNAIATAQSNLAEDVIKIERGVYGLPNGFTYLGAGLFTGGSLSLRGGYGNDCVDRSIDPTNTILHGLGASSAQFSFQNMQHALELDALSVYAAQGFSISSADCTNSSGLVNLRRLRIEQGGGFGLNLDSGCVDYRLENLLVANNSDGGIAIAIRAAADLDLVHATVFSNDGDGIAVVNASGPATVRVESSIIWANLTDIYTLESLYGDHNTYASLSGGGSLSGSSNESLNPQLDANFRPVEPSSPAINRADPSPVGGLPASDIVGNARNVDGYPDRGAFESGVDGNAGVLVVSNTNDSGAGSLRAAISSSNASAGRQLIHFNIPGDCPRTIALNSTLPALVDRALIDGYTQPGSAPNTANAGFNASLCVILRPAFAGNSLSGGLLVSGSDEDPVTIRGLAFSGFDASNAAAVSLQSGRGHQVEGNQFGGEVAGVALLASRDQVRVDAAVEASTIGGGDPAQANLIGGALANGVLIRDGASQIQVLGNLIGVSALGLGALPNQTGVQILNAPDNTVANNLISGNLGHGVLIAGAQSDRNQVHHNRIGLKAFGFCFPLPCSPDYALGNGGDGVRIDNAAGDPLFSAPVDSRLQSNQIAYNTGDGVRVRAGTGHAISGSIYDNGGLAIDLGNDGSDANDDDSAAAAALMANRGLNAPVITSAGGAPQDGIITGTLSTTAGSYTIDLYASPGCDAAGRGEARTWIESTTREVVGSGQVTVSWGTQVLPASSIAGQVITASVRDQNGNTSEFSACQSYDSGGDGVFSNGFE